MKVWKKIAAMAMAIGMVASLAACGNTSSKQEGDDNGLKTAESAFIFPRPESELEMGALPERTSLRFRCMLMEPLN